MSGITAKRQSDTESLLELLQDPAAVSQRLSEIKAAEDRAREVIDLAGPAQEILNLREQIGVQAAQQEKELQECDAQCSLKLSEAETQAKNIEDASVRRAEDVRTQAEGVLGDANQKLADAEQRMQAVLVNQTQTDNLRTELEAKISGVTLHSEAITQRESELLQEKSKLNALVEHIRTALE